MTRAEKVKQAQALRAEGLKLREIGALMGDVSPKTVSGWLNDPDLSRQQTRRTRYSRPCVDCGTPTDGSGGYAAARRRCANCNAIHISATQTIWTREHIIDELLAWAKELGRAPTADEAKPAGCRVPCVRVQERFGSWNAGIAAAGFVPRGPGERLTYRTKIAA